MNGRRAVVPGGGNSALPSTLPTTASGLHVARAQDSSEATELNVRTLVQVSQIA
jgi:hypothetical protein